MTNSKQTYKVGPFILTEVKEPGVLARELRVLPNGYKISTFLDKMQNGFLWGDIEVAIFDPDGNWVTDLTCQKNWNDNVAKFPINEKGINALYDLLEEVEALPPKEGTSNKTAPQAHSVPPTPLCDSCDAFKSMFGGINHEKDCPAK